MGIEGSKMSILTDNLVVYIENSKESARILTEEELLSEFSKFVG